jgi:uncharacterized membrane protein
VGWGTRISLGLMALFYVLVGINHFRDPGFYLKMMPPYLPWHAQLVLLSGVAEIGLGLALLVPPLRIYAAWGIVALLIAVFPANLPHGALRRAAARRRRARLDQLGAAAAPDPADPLGLVAHPSLLRHAAQRASGVTRERRI